MRTIIVDDERYGLERFRMESRDIEDIEIIAACKNPLDALALAKRERIELAFLDIQMPEMNGLELSDKLREIYPDMIIIFISAYEEYMQDAFTKRGADYYLVKPYTKEEITAVIQRAKLLSKRFAKRIYIETFGRFNVYVDEKPLQIASSDAKELLALLVDRKGTSLGNKEAFEIMYPTRSFDDPSSTVLYKAIRRLKDCLTEAGIDELVKQITPGEHCVNTDLFDCDYYQFLNNDSAAIRKFDGKYMYNWDWGAVTASYLQKLKNRADKALFTNA